LIESEVLRPPETDVPKSIFLSCVGDRTDMVGASSLTSRGGAEGRAMERQCTKQVRLLEDRLAELRSREHRLAETTKRLREEAKLL
jgi:hypothetical protein